MGTRDMRTFVKAVSSDLDWESKSLELWTHQRGPLSGADLDGRGCAHLEHQLSNGQLVSQAAGQEKLCSAGCLEIELHRVHKHQVGLLQLGLPWPALRLLPVLPPQTSILVGNPILIPRRMILAYAGCHNVLRALLSLCNAIASSIYIFFTFLQWLWFCMSLEEPQVFLQVSCLWQSSKCLAVCFSLWLPTS